MGAGIASILGVHRIGAGLASVLIYGGTKAAYAVVYGSVSSLFYYFNNVIRKSIIQVKNLHPSGGGWSYLYRR